MSYHKSIGAILVPILIVLLSLNYMPCKAQLSDETFYDATCPNALSTIRTSVNTAVSNPRVAALIIRLHFHDCFVQGCDASILLDDAPNEKTQQENAGVMGYGTIDVIKADVESVCPGVVSCADILAVASRDASVAVGGPSWPVSLGRRDSPAADPAGTTDLPRGDFRLTQLIDNFARKNLSPRDMVALSGSHTIGQAQCVTFRARIYDNASIIDPIFASNLRDNCPEVGPTGNGNLEPLDLVTPNTFDNNYFRNLFDRRGLLTSDQELFSGDSTDSIVQEYIDNPSTFNSDFAAAMIRMGDIEPLTGANGIIRTLCTTAN